MGKEEICVCICLCKNISGRIHKKLTASVTSGEDNRVLGSRKARESLHSLLLYLLDFELHEYFTHSEIKEKVKVYYFHISERQL